MVLGQNDTLEGVENGGEAEIETSQDPIVGHIKSWALNKPDYGGALHAVQRTHL